MNAGRLWTVGLILALGLVGLLPGQTVWAGTYQVTNTDDSGPGSLRWAIQQANASPGPDTITFNIPGAGLHVIAPLSALPVLTGDGTTLDGYTQPGAAPATAGTAAVLYIEIDGSGVPGNNGLNIASAYNKVRGLVINRFAYNGIAVATATATGNVIAGNHIGTDATGTLDQGNGVNGVFIGLGARDNTVGGDEPAERNVISGNGWEGVGIHGSATMGNVVSGNYIGTQASGRAALGNATQGVRIYGAAHHNTVGGIIPGARNVISGNVGDGVRLVGVGTNGNVVTGNFIGTDDRGAAAVGNQATGVNIRDGAWGNTVGGENATPGGSCTGACNLISGNGLGIDLTGAGTDANLVSGNYIGTDLGGTVDLGNNAFGMTISFGAGHNVVGGDTPGERNLISGNGRDGVYLYAFTAEAQLEVGSVAMTANVVSGNYIGTDVSGAVAMANDWSGVNVGPGVEDTVIGGDAPGEGNVISGNAESGVEVNLAQGTVVSGNLIGADASGLRAVGNGRHGIYVYYAPDTTIGGPTSSELNLIAGNRGDGVYLTGSATAGTTVLGNMIGAPNIDLPDLANGAKGVHILAGAHDNTVGPNNLLALNDSGIVIDGEGCDNNFIRGNAVVFSDLDGVHIAGGAFGSTVGPDNVIAYNGGDGVQIAGATTADNIVTRNSIFGNGESGIELQGGANGGVLAPSIVSVTRATDELQIIGQACAGCTVELFASSLGDGEGQTYLGAGLADGGGWFDLVVGSLVHPYLTTTATQVSAGTSEFSAAVMAPVHLVRLPMVPGDR